MKPHAIRPIGICMILYFIVLIAFLSHIYFFTDWQNYLHASQESRRHDFSEGWTREDGEVIDIAGSEADSFKTGQTVTKQLPEVMSETDAICLSTSNLHFFVYVDDVLIYSYDTRENMTGTGDGVSYHIIGLGTKDEGKTIRIEGQTVFASGTGGRINQVQFETPEAFRYQLMKSNMLAFDLSFLMIIFGLVVTLFFFGMSRNNPIVRPLWALGLSAMLFGIWSACDTGIPQFFSGGTYATRELVYGVLHFAGLPLVYFINAITKTKRQIYLYLSFGITVVCVSWLVIARYAFGRDLHTMVGVVYLAYASQLLLMVSMLVDNEIYCRRKNRPSNLRYFYAGAGVFVLTCFVDMGRYLTARKGSIGHGSWFRFGLVIFFIFMAFQIFDWWAREKTSLERDRFVNQLLQYVMGSMDPEEKIDRVLEYLCQELHADRAYIFEDNHDGTFDNTYEYCAPGVTAEIDNLKGVPFEGTLDAWYEEYHKNGHVMIYDLEKYKTVSESIYNILKPQGINTLVTGPLILEGQYIGFFGVDNPPTEAMVEISEIIRLLMFFLSGLVARRDEERRLKEYSYRDSLTGVGNRRALSEFEMERLDTYCPYGFLMCDINGLKAVNDNQGHEAGDALIKTVAETLSQVFGAEYVFRMGGDEFAVYAFDQSKEAFERRINEADAVITAQGCHVAIGFSYAEDGDPDFHGRKVEADNRMYEAKRNFYRDGHDRRRPRA